MRQENIKRDFELKLKLKHQDIIINNNALMLELETLDELSRVNLQKWLNEAKLKVEEIKNMLSQILENNNEIFT